MVPLDEHSTRVINHAVIVQPLPAPVKALAAARPRWIDHLLLNEIFDGDMAYLAQASANSKRRDGFGSTWAQDYYLPAKADGCAELSPWQPGNLHFQAIIRRHLFFRLFGHHSCRSAEHSAGSIT